MKVSLSLLTAAVLAGVTSAELSASVDVLGLSVVTSGGGQEQCADVGLSGFGAKLEPPSGDFCPGPYSGSWHSGTCLGRVDMTAACDTGIDDVVGATITYFPILDCNCKLKVKVKGGTYTALYLSEGLVISGQEYYFTADGTRIESQGAGISNIELCYVCGNEGGGDPHFASWNQEWFDFHGACDLVLMEAPDFKNGLGLTAHVRTKGRYEYSYIEAAAIKIGEETFEVGSYGTYMLNGVEGVGNGRLHGGIAGFPITHTVVNKKTHEFAIQLEEDSFIRFKTYKDLVAVRFEGPNPKDFATAVGLAGKWRTGEHLARDGKTIIEDDNEFGNEWVVGVHDPQIFAAPSENPGVCIMPTATQRRLGEGGISLEAAELACAHMGTRKEQCIFDVMATGDFGAADAGAF